MKLEKYMEKTKRLFSVCIFDRFLVFRFQLISSLIGASFIVYAQFIQDLFQELLQQKYWANKLPSMYLYMYVHQSYEKPKSECSNAKIK